MSPIDVLVLAIGNAILRGDLETARDRYKLLTREVGADSTREGFTHDLRRQQSMLKQIEDAEAATRRR